MQFRILGPLEVAERDVTRPLGGARQRAVLAILLVHRGEVVSGERLIEELWGEHAPATAAKVLQAYISRLRKAIGGDVLCTRGRGYVLSPAAGELDLDEFERLAGDGRTALAAGDAAAAAARLREALGLWRGPPLADFTYEAFARGEIARLEEARLAALADRIDADLALGRHDRLVPELELLAREHPLREHLCAQRMLALYRAGRQAEALQAYRDSRQILIDQLGIEPGRELRELHQAIIGQDQRLDLQGQTQVRASREVRHSAAFVGRQRELSELAGALQDAAGGQGRLCLVSGEPGIGKSRLAAELARHARAQGAQVLVGRCWEAGGAPAFWPWVQSLRSYLRAVPRDELVTELGPGAAEIAAILPELHELIHGLGRPAAPESEGARFRLFHATAEFLRRASEKRSLVFILDDLHAADTPSLLLLQYLARAAGTPGKAIGYARGAAERAVSALAYEEAVRLYQMALQAHGREEPPAATVRCELLLALGDAQTRAGDTPAAKQSFLLAAGLARRTGEAMARAALGYGGRFVFNVSRDDPRLRPLLEQALAELGEGDSVLRAMLLARLAGGPLRDEPTRERRASLSDQAVAMARRVGDPALLRYVLDARYMAIWAPDNIEERWAMAAEMVEVGGSTGDLERLFQGHAYRIGTLLELGDLAAVSAEVGFASRIADELRQPAQLWMVAAVRSLCALLEGRFQEAGDLIEEAFRLGERTIPWNAAVTRHLQLFALRREQGRLDELEETVKGAPHAHRAYPVWRCVLADLYAQLGRQDDARAEFERFAAGDFTELPFNEAWLLGMTLLAEVCTALGDVARSVTLYELLLPYRELHAVDLTQISFGAVARALGKLAATAGRFEQAAQHFEAAIQLNQRSGARPWTAHARHDYARMLIARGDYQNARQQLAQALATYRELGMDPWADSALALGSSALPTGVR